MNRFFIFAFVIFAATAGIFYIAGEQSSYVELEDALAKGELAEIKRVFSKYEALSRCDECRVRLGYHPALALRFHHHR